MRHRHEVVEIEPITTPAIRYDSTVDISTVDDDDAIELIDDTRAPEPILPEPVGGSPAPRRSTGSALPSSRPITPHRPHLPWGLGTDGWPRHNSRLVRLFACDPDELLTGVVGRTWDVLSLGPDVSSVDTDPWPLAIDGSLQMPYPSRPLAVELRAQPFHDRYCRVDLVLCSHHRWPRRYFDVASRCLSRMQHLERVPMGG